MRSRYTLLRTSSSSSVDILRQKWAKRLIFWTGISISTLFISTMLLFYYAYTYYDGDDSDSSGYGRELELEALLTPIDLRGGDGGRRRPGIAIVTVVDRVNQVVEYELALKTLRCYCQIHGYELISVNILKQREEEEKEELDEGCTQKDFMFRRHCAVRHILQTRRDLEYVLFLDSDIAVINPSHLVEEFLPKSGAAYDLIFYQRIFNGEIAAGSYFARNTNFTANFLKYWSDYQDKLPNSWHGTDNGAIHATFLDTVCERCSERRKTCLRLWGESRDDDGLRMFSDCVHSVLGRRNVFSAGKTEGTILLMTDSREYWVRDGWLTQNRWSKRDFMLHGWKKKWQNHTTWGGWMSPFSEDEEKNFLEKCNSSGSAAENVGWAWIHNQQKFRLTDREILEKLTKIKKETLLTQMEYFKRIEIEALNED